MIADGFERHRDGLSGGDTQSAQRITPVNLHHRIGETESGSLVLARQARVELGERLEQARQIVGAPGSWPGCQPGADYEERLISVRGQQMAAAERLLEAILNCLAQRS